MRINGKVLAFWLDPHFPDPDREYMERDKVSVIVRRFSNFKDLELVTNN